MMAWLEKLKGYTMATVDKRKREAMSALVKESGVSENAVIRVVEAMKNVDAVGIALLLDFDNNQESVMGDEIDTGTSEEDATFEDGAPENSGDDAPDGSGK